MSLLKWLFKNEGTIRHKSCKLPLRHALKHPWWKVIGEQRTTSTEAMIESTSASWWYGPLFNYVVVFEKLFQPGVSNSSSKISVVPGLVPIETNNGWLVHFERLLLSSFFNPERPFLLRTSGYSLVQRRSPSVDQDEPSREHRLNSLQKTINYEVGTPGLPGCRGCQRRRS